MSKNNQPDFLIVGLEKSGTHWISALLNSHPQIACFPSMPFLKESGEFRHDIGEVHLFNTMASLEPNNQGKFTRPIADYLTKYNKVFSGIAPYEGKVPKEKLYQMLIKRYNELCVRKRRDKKMVGESTPAYIFHLDFIDSFYPHIKKICTIRDPKDRVVSWHYNQIRKGRKKETTISDKFALDYCRTRIKKEYQAMLNYHGHIHCLTYEALTYHTKQSVKDILDYLGGHYNQTIIDRMIKKASFKSLTAKDTGREGRARGQQVIASQFRKGIVGDWKNHLSNKQASMIDKYINNLQTKIFNKYNVKI